MAQKEEKVEKHGEEVIICGDKHYLRRMKKLREGEKGKE